MKDLSVLKCPFFYASTPPALCRVQSLDESSLKINPQAFGTNPYVAIPPIPDISHKLLLSKQSVVEITRFKSTENSAARIFLKYNSYTVRARFVYFLPIF